MESPTFSTATTSRASPASLTPRIWTPLPPRSRYFSPRDDTVPLQRLTCFLWNYIRRDWFLEAIPLKFSPFLSGVGLECEQRSTAHIGGDQISACLMNIIEPLRFLGDKGLYCCALDKAEVVEGSPEYARIAV